MVQTKKGVVLELDLDLTSEFFFSWNVYPGVEQHSFFYTVHQRPSTIKDKFYVVFLPKLT